MFVMNMPDNISKLSDGFLRSDFAKDTLTGLLNREAFNIKASERINSGEKGLAIVWINISNFKKYNNRFGFNSGNILLCELSEILTEVFKSKNGDIVSRFSGDNFVVITTWDDLDENITFTEKYLYSLHPGITLRLRAGVYFPSANENILEACDKAKMACDSIRTNYSLNACMYREEMGKEMEMEHYILDVLDDALNSGNIKVLYQPIVRILNNNICEVEALVRWKNDVLGFISPGDFIPTLEKYSEIHKIDTYTVKQVCEDLKNLAEKNLPLLPVSINLSRLDFELCDIFSVIENTLSEYNIPRNMLKIEITESVHGEDMSVLNLGIEKFRAYGYEVWMDDFGSGYSSLNMLKDTNFDTIKFDMKFLSGFDENSDKARYILSSNLSMAKQMGMQSLCEGVETPEQLEYLRTIGFEKAQGYFFGRPMTLDNIFELELPIENIQDSPYYEKLGKFEILDDEILDHAGTIVADMRAAAIFEITNDQIKLLTKNKTYSDWLKNLTEDSKRELINYFLKRMKRMKLNHDPDSSSSSSSGNRFYIFSNGNLFQTRIAHAAENSRTGSEAWVLYQKALTYFPLNHDANDRARIYEAYMKIFAMKSGDNFLRLD